MKIRVYYEDTDCGNVVYYANYLKYMERSRTEFLRKRGICLSSLQKEGYLFVVAEASIKYKAPARYDDLLEVESTIAGITPVSLIFDSVIRNEDQKLLSKGRVKLAFTNNQGKLWRIPDKIINLLS